MRKTSPEKTKANREHHLTFFKEWYKDIGFKYAYAMVKFEQLLKELDDIEKDAKRTDVCRRENAVHMGVSIWDSDKEYCLDDVIKGVPKVVEHIKKVRKQFGMADE